MDTTETIALRAKLAAISERLDRHYRAFIELQGIVAQQHLVLSTLVEHHEDLPTIGPDAAQIPLGVLRILREQVTKIDAAQEAVSGILKPDHDAAMRQTIDRMIRDAAAHLRPDAS